MADREITMIEQKNNIFHLATQNTSYVFMVLPNNNIEHVYYGHKLLNPFLDIKAIQSKQSFESRYHNYVDKHNMICLDTLSEEITSEGYGDYKTPSFCAINMRDESRSFNFTFKSFATTKGIVRMDSTLPQALASEETAESLVVTLQDKIQKVELDLVYTLFPLCDVITKRAVFRNTSNDKFFVTTFSSSIIDIPGHDYLINGDDLKNGKLVFSTRTNTTDFPSFTIANKRDSYYVDLIYSGPYRTTVEKNEAGFLHIVQEENGEVSQRIIHEGERLETPEAVLSYSNFGLPALRKNISFFISNHISRGLWKNRLHPVIFNTRKSFYDKLNEDKIVKIIDTAKEMGAEMVVVDDLWFGARTRDGGSLGDWKVNTLTLPSGIAELAANAHRKGLLFGLWFEIEAVSTNSLLYKAHPDWIISDQDAANHNSQLILDLTKSEVQDFILNTFIYYAETNKVDYIKWNFTSIISDYSQTKNSAYLSSYMKALYKIQKSLRTACPQLMIECSSNGYQIDLATLCHVTQVTAPKSYNDLDYIKLFNKTYPSGLLCNEITKLSSFSYKAFGSICYSLPFLTLSKEEKKALKEQIEFYKQYRAVLQFGIFSSKDGLISVTNPEHTIAIVLVQEKDKKLPLLRFEDLNEEYTYEVFPLNIEKGDEEYYQVLGSTLKWAGIKLKLNTINKPTLYLIKKLGD